MSKDIRCRYFYEIKVLKKEKEFNYSGYILHEDAWSVVSLGSTASILCTRKVKEETSKDWDTFIKELKDY